MRNCCCLPCLQFGLSRRLFLLLNMSIVLVSVLGFVSMIFIIRNPDSNETGFLYSILITIISAFASVAGFVAHKSKNSSPILPN